MKDDVFGCNSRARIHILTFQQIMHKQKAVRSNLMATTSVPLTLLQQFVCHVQQFE
jgi:hypothetical protein